jgi:hypothetical protein
MTTTTIALKHRKFRGSQPYICHGVPGHSDASCDNFASALEYASKMGCTTVEVKKGHAPRDAKLSAAKARIDLIVTE